MAEALSELVALLGPGPGAAAARAGAAEAALSLSGSAEGRRLLAAHPAALAALLELAAGPRPCPAAGRCLLNVAAEPQARGPLLAALPALLGLLPAGPACGALANLCREPPGARRVLRGLRESGRGLQPLLGALGEPRPPPELGPLLCNLSQVPEGRRALLDRSRCSVQRLLPFTQYRDSVGHRRGIVGALRNCCFEHGEGARHGAATGTVLPLPAAPGCWGWQGARRPQEQPQSTASAHGARRGVWRGTQGSRGWSFSTMGPAEGWGCWAWAGEGSGGGS
ncbi:Protein HGH1-like protein [Aix galericulata]|nr:Protein HGH1-like protein [Aix galericulata]